MPTRRSEYHPNPNTPDSKYRLLLSPTEVGYDADDEIVSGLKYMIEMVLDLGSDSAEMIIKQIEIALNSLRLNSHKTTKHILVLRIGEEEFRLSVKEALSTDSDTHPDIKNMARALSVAQVNSYPITFSFSLSDR